MNNNDATAAETMGRSSSWWQDLGGSVSSLEQVPSEAWPTVLVVTAVVCLVFSLLLPRSWSWDVKSRITSSLHAVTVAYFSAVSLSRYYDLDDAEFMWRDRTPLIVHNVAIASGYLVADTCLCIYAADIRVALTFVHHLAVGGAFILGLATSYTTPFHCAFLLNEISTPFVNNHTFLANSSLRTPNGALMWLVFFFGRIVVNFWFIGSILRTMWAPFVFSEEWLLLSVLQLFLCTISQVLNWYWFYLMTWGLLKKVFGIGVKSKRPKQQ